MQVGGGPGLGHECVHVCCVVCVCVCVCVCESGGGGQLFQQDGWLQPWLLGCHVIWPRLIRFYKPTLPFPFLSCPALLSQVLYEFAVDAGQMDRSRYFGFSSDLYHFDHFMVIGGGAGVTRCDHFMVRGGWCDQV